MDLDQMLLMQRQSARISELESWLALFIVLHGQPNGSGHRYKLCQDHASSARDKMSGYEPSIAIEYDFAADMHTLDLL